MVSEWFQNEIRSITYNDTILYHDVIILCIPQVFEISYDMSQSCLTISSVCILSLGLVSTDFGWPRVLSFTECIVLRSYAAWANPNTPVPT